MISSQVTSLLSTAVAIGCLFFIKISANLETHVRKSSHTENVAPISASESASASASSNSSSSTASASDTTYQFLHQEPLLVPVSVPTEPESEKTREFHTTGTTSKRELSGNSDWNMQDSFNIVGFNIPIRAGDATTSGNLVYQNGILWYQDTQELDETDEEDTTDNDENLFIRPDQESIENDIDCERFFYLSICQGQSQSQGQGQNNEDNASSPADMPTSPPKPPPLPPPIDNLVSVQLSVGLEQPIQNMELFTMVLARVVTRVIDFYTPFDVYYFQDEFVPFSQQAAETETTSSPFGNLFQPMTPTSTPAPGNNGGRKRRILQTKDKTIYDLGNITASQEQFRRVLGQGGGKKPPPAFDLLYAWTLVEPLSRTTTVMNEDNVEEEIYWYWTRIEYAAFFGSPPSQSGGSSGSGGSGGSSGSGGSGGGGSSGNTNPDEGDDLVLRPVVKASNIGNITWLCQQTVNNTIINGVFTDGIQEGIAQFFGETILVDETGSTAESGADMSPAEPSDTATESGGNDWWSFYGVTMVGDEDKDLSTLEETGTNNNVVAPTSEASYRVYEEPLALKFELREWFGLGLGAMTIVVALSLTLWAGYLQRKQVAQEAWGAVFTEQGINDVLQVGWRYQEPDDGSGDGGQDHGNGQLFLQVYDKTKIGYNDEDSVLQGGVERQEFTAPTLPTSGDATTTTPRGASSQSSHAESSNLPSTSFSAASPESRSHEYEEESQRVRRRLDDLQDLQPNQ